MVWCEKRSIFLQHVQFRVALKGLLCSMLLKIYYNNNYYCIGCEHNISSFVINAFFRTAGNQA